MVQAALLFMPCIVLKINPIASFETLLLLLLLSSMVVVVVFRLKSQIPDIKTSLDIIRHMQSRKVQPDNIL